MFEYRLYFLRKNIVFKIIISAYWRMKTPIYNI